MISSAHTAALFSCIFNHVFVSLCRVVTIKLNLTSRIIWLSLLGIGIGFAVIQVRITCGLTYFYFTLLYFTLLYFTLLYFTLLYFTLLYFTLLYFTLLYFTLLYFTLLYFTLLYFTLLYFTLLYFTLLYFTLLYFTLLYFTLLYLLYFTLLYFTLLYFTLLYFTLLYFTVYSSDFCDHYETFNFRSLVWWWQCGWFVKLKERERWPSTKKGYK